MIDSDSARNLLGCDGDVRYHGVVFNELDKNRLRAALLEEIVWEHDIVQMFGKRIVTGRKIAWMAEDSVTYRYSGMTKVPQVWTPAVREIKTIAEGLTGESYNSWLLNLYHHGEEGMGWHSDDEKSIVPGSSIASLSFGAERKFSFKHKQSKETVSILLEDGSLLDMRGETQQHWVHQLPKIKQVREPRINLTLRIMRL